MKEKMIRRPKLPHRNAGHLVDDEGGALDVIRLPGLRNVRHEEYLPFLSCFDAGREWAEESPDLVFSAQTKASFRSHLVGCMRNNMWFIRNHRTVSVETVLAQVREYGGHERLLELAGVSPVVLSMMVHFFAGDCRCKGDCRSLDFDPLFPSHSSGVCDHLLNSVAPSWGRKAQGVGLQVDAVYTVHRDPQGLDVRSKDDE